LRVVFVTAPEPSAGVDASGRWIPLGLVHLAGAARDAGHDCRILDALSLGIGPEETAKRVLSERPDVVCVTSATAGFPAAIDLCRRVRGSGVVSVIGGIHASFMYPEFLPPGGVDFAVVGEGEETLPELLHCLEEEQDPSRVAGLAFPLGGRVVRTAPRPRMATMDPLPKAWDLLDWKLYTWAGRPGSRLAATVTSRGCPEPCSSCPHTASGDGAWRGRSPDSVAYEISVLRREYGADFVALFDPAPAADAGRWKRLVDRLMELELGVDFLMYSRAEDVVRDGRWIDRWRAAGIVHVGLCRDPGSDRLTGAEAAAALSAGRNAVRLLRERGISSEATFWLGFPDETPRSIAETEDRARAWDPDVARFRLVAPLPYTPAWRSMSPHVVTRDYRRFNHREPVVKPTEMSLEEIREAAWNAGRRFEVDRATLAGSGESRRAGSWTVHAPSHPAGEGARGDSAQGGEAVGGPKKPGPQA
jgi:anaerobic magnesium-protoporphyrin IX monomethyl ester cyclase